MHARNRTWLLGSDPVERCRQRTMNVEGGDGSTLSLDFTTGVLDPRLTFSRASGGTYVGNDGFVYGVDFATSSSLAIGTGSKSVTLTATAGQSRRYEIGQTVYIANGANNMSGAVTAYSAATQVLTINATSSSGSGSFTSWIVGNASARFDYDPTTLQPRGLLIEGSASNLLSYSEDFSNAAWTKSNTNGSMTLTGTAPDNNATSRLLEENTTSYAKHSLERSINISAGIHTFSVWLKEPTSNSRRYAHIQLADGQGTAARYTIVADLQTGTIIASGVNNGSSPGSPTGTGHSITAYPNGWYRVTISMNHVLSPSYPTIMLGDTATLFGGNNQPFYAATTPYKGLIVWGAQFETGSGASSYIPTGASTGSRAADSCVMTGTNFSSWFAGATEGVFYAEYEAPRSLGTADYYCLSTVYAAGTFIGIILANSTRYPQAAISPGGGYRVSGGISVAASTPMKHAAKWSGANNVLVFANGAVGTAHSATSGTPTLTMFSIGSSSTSGTAATGDYLNACMRRVKFWPVALPDSQIISITT